MTPIRIKLLDVRAQPPTKGTPNSVGWDLRSLDAFTLHPQETVVVSTGIAIAIPQGFEGQVRSRSSLGTLGIVVAQGIGTIDPDYRGEIRVPLYNQSKRSVEIPRKGKVAQLVIAPVAHMAGWCVCAELDWTERGEGGFGSTGLGGE